MGLLGIFNGVSEIMQIGFLSLDNIWINTTL